MTIRLSRPLSALAAILTAGSALAQEPAPPAEAATTHEWRVFSRSDTHRYLIDLSSIAEAPDGAARVRVARVSITKPAGDYSHVVDTFGVRCGARETRVETTTEVFEDGEGSETFPVDEPWTRAPEGSLDEAINQTGCREGVPVNDAFPSIRAYIDAGRP